MRHFSYPIRIDYLIAHRNCSNLRTKLGKSENSIISSKSNHKIYQIRHDSVLTGIELILYQTKYRPKEHQKLPSKKPLVDLFAVILIRDNANTLPNVNASLSRHFTLLHDQK